MVFDNIGSANNRIDAALSSFGPISGIIQCGPIITRSTLRWRHNGRDCISNHQPHDCLLNRLFGRRSKKATKLRVTDLCAVNSPGTGEFPAQMASDAGNVSIWWRHHEFCVGSCCVICCIVLGHNVFSHEPAVLKWIFAYDLRDAQLIWTNGE